MSTPDVPNSRRRASKATFRVKRDSAHGISVLVEQRRGAVVEANEFLRALQARGLSPHTLRAYAFDLAALYQWLRASKRQLTQLQQPDLLDFIREQRDRGASARTINRRLTTARQLYRFCTDQEIPRGRGTSLPAPYYRGRGKDRVVGIHELSRRSQLKLRVAVARRLVEPLTREQVGLVLRSLRRYRDLGIVQLMLFCGLRSAEVLSLKLGDVSFEEGQVLVCGKGRKERMLPLPRTLLETLRSYLQLERPSTPSPELFLVLQGSRRAQPMTRAGLRNLFRHRRGKSGLANANPHRFRHTFGADMARAGVRLAVLQKMMGHEDPTITLQYINLSMADVAAEFQRASAEIQRRYDEGEPS